MDIIKKLFTRKEENADKFVNIWVDMHLSRMFEKSGKKADLPLLTRIASISTHVREMPAEIFFAEMLAAELNLFGFVCDRLKPELNHLISQMMLENYLSTLHDPYRCTVHEAYVACKEMAQGYATNPIFGYRTVALAVATRLNLLHSQGAVRLLTEQLQKTESEWEEDFKITMLDQYDKNDPAEAARAATLKARFRQHLLSSAIEDMGGAKTHKPSDPLKPGKPNLHLVGKS